MPFLEVRDRQGRELVTVIELLSPSNKRAGDDREQYLAKRRELLRSPAHLVEIDLLRGWTPMPQEGRPECDYSVMVSRAEKRRAAEFWPIRLRDRLPVIPIPLRPPDDAAPVDLQEALHRAYDGPGYEHFIYRGESGTTPVSKRCGLGPAVRAGECVMFFQFRGDVLMRGRFPCGGIDRREFLQRGRRSDSGGVGRVGPGEGGRHARLARAGRSACPVRIRAGSSRSATRP